MIESIPGGPVAKTVPHTFTHLGKTYTDEYVWLQDKDDPEVIAYLKAENDYAHSVLGHTAALQESLFEEMKGRIKADDASVPEPRDKYLYYWRMIPGKQYRVFCRRLSAPENAPEQVLIDENALAEGKEYCRVAIFEPSPDHTLLAYAVDFTGSWVFDLFVKDLRTDKVVAGPIPSVAWTAVWASDNRTLFYTIFDAAHRPFKLLRYVVGSPVDSAVEIFHEPDEAFNVGIQRTRSGSFLLLSLESHSTTEVHYLPADQPASTFTLIHPRQHKIEYSVDHHSDRFLILSNEDAENFKLLEAPTNAPSKANWREVIPHRPDVLLETVYAFRDHLVIRERKDGLPQLRLSAPDGHSNVRYVTFPEPVYTFNLTTNPEYATDTLRFLYSSPVTPESTIDYDMRTNAWNVRKVQEIPSGYGASAYACQRLFATTPDGTRVPISIVYRKDKRKSGPQPLMMEGYGSYGISTDANFSQQRISLLDRGFIYALAHVRGGSELGRAWYEQGRLMYKKNTFTDFIACAEHLIAAGYTSSDQLAILGGSAGGLLMGAVTNMRPDLFKAVVAMVPFTNVITAMLMPELPLTVTEYEQWGHPDDPEAFAYIYSYSPYENVEAKAYPHLYVKAGLHDLQVPFWDPAKYVARLRARKTDSNRLVLVTNMGAGHSGHSGRYDRLREIAEIYAFVIDSLGVSA